MNINWFSINIFNFLILQVIFNAIWSKVSKCKLIEIKKGLSFEERAIN